jgi:hypothetical protein
VCRKSIGVMVKVRGLVLADRGVDVFFFFQQWVTFYLYLNVFSFLWDQQDLFAPALLLLAYGFQLSLLRHSMS